jgi:TolB-like protein/DNA-binding SARP family transcriptional activator/Tfp pilus assembly protein PilF
MHILPTLTLRMFGGFALEGDGGALSGRAAQRKRLALLSLLGAAPGGALSRDKLVGLLWAESGTERARHQLSSSLYELRRVLGEQAILAVGDELRLNPAVVQVDVVAFRQAVADEDWGRVVTLYTGTFLDGFFVSGAPGFERWLDAEREQHARAFAGALERVAEAHERAGDLPAAVVSWRRLAAHDPCDSRVALRLMEALAAAGDAAGALRHAGVHAALLREDCDLAPAPEIAALVERLRHAQAPAAAADGATLPEQRAATVDLLATAEAPDSPAAAGAPDPLATAEAPAAGLAPPDTAPSLGAPEPATAHVATFLRRAQVRPGAVAAALLAVIALATAVLAVWSGSADSAVPAEQGDRVSIAVLSFVDLSPGGDEEFFSDGLAEELIHALSQLDGLRVVARTSAFAFKGRNIDVREIGSVLGVGSVLEGSVRRSGDRVKITVQLVDTRTGYQIWSHAYEPRITEIFEVQEEISRAIVASLRPALLRSADAPFITRTTASAEAYQLYMQGRYFWNQRTEQGLLLAVERFEAAVRADPQYAEAYTGLSDAHNSLADNGFRPSGPALERAEAAVRTALTLDPGLADAYSSRGHLRLHRWDWAGAEADFRRALELNPGYAVARQYYAFLLVFQGRFDEALPHITRAGELDPMSVAIQNNVGDVHYLSRRYARAVEQFRIVLEMDSTRHESRYLLAASLLELGRIDEAIAGLEKLVAEGGGWHRSALPLLGTAYLGRGRRAEAAAIAATLDAALAQGRLAAPVTYAGLLAALGRQDDAFAVLDLALETMPSVLVTVGVAPRIDTLRADPRYPVFLRRIGLSPPPR